MPFKQRKTKDLEKPQGLNSEACATPARSLSGDNWVTVRYA
jgi:hypothetical protein